MIIEKSNAIHAVQQELLQDLSRLANDVLYKSEQLEGNSLATELVALSNIAFFGQNLLVHLLLKKLSVIIDSGNVAVDDEIVYQSLDLSQRLLLEANYSLFDEWFLQCNKVHQKIHDTIYSFPALDKDLINLAQVSYQENHSQFSSIQIAMQLFIVAALKNNSSKDNIANKIKLALSKIESKSVFLIQLKDLLNTLFKKEQSKDDLMFLGRLERALNKHLVDGDIEPLKKIVFLIIEWKLPESLLKANSNENFLSYFARLKFNSIAHDLRDDSGLSQQDMLQLLQNNHVLLNVFSIYKGTSSIDQKRFNYIKEKLFVHTEKNEDKKNRLLALIESKQKLVYEIKEDLGHIRESVEQGQLNITEISKSFEKFAHIASIAEFSKFSKAANQFSSWINTSDNLDESLPEIIVDFEGALERLQGNTSLSESPNILSIAKAWLGNESSLSNNIDDDLELDYQVLDSGIEPSVDDDKAYIFESAEQVEQNNITKLKESLNIKLEDEDSVDGLTPTNDFNDNVEDNEGNQFIEDLDFELDWDEESVDAEKSNGSEGDQTQKRNNLEVVKQQSEEQSSKSAEGEGDNPKKSLDEKNNAQIIPLFSNAANSENRSNNALDFLDDKTDEIRTIFFEEAYEIILQLEELYEKWEADEKDVEYPTLIRKHFHTLKGSSKMVGLENLGNLSWSTENMLNNFISHKVDYHPAILQALYRSLAWVQNFENNEDDDDSVYQVIALLDELSSYLIEDSDSGEERKAYLDSLIAETAGVDEHIEPQEKPIKQLSKNEILDIKALYGIASYFKKHKNQFDNNLFENYKSSLINGINQFDFLFEPKTILSGDSVLANIKSICNKLSSCLEGIGKLPTYDEAVGAMLLSQQYTAIKELSFEDFAEFSISEALDEFEQVSNITESIARFEEINNLCNMVIEQLKLQSDDNQFGDKLLSESALLFLKQFDCYASGLVIPSVKALQSLVESQLYSDELSNSGLEAVKGDFDFFEKEIRSVYDILDTNDHHSVDNPDIEIQTIFLEEADELLERFALQLASWENIDDNQGLSNIQRILHTLKGSAYSANYSGLGESVHLHEDLLEKLQLEKVNSADQLKELEVIYHDLHERVTSIQAKLDSPGSQSTEISPEKEQEKRFEPIDSGSLIKSAQKTQKQIADVQGSSTSLRLSSDFIQEISELTSENNVSRAQLEANLKAVDRIFNDVNSTLSKLNQNVKELEIEAVQQTIETKRNRLSSEEFDSLEMDRYPKVYELSQRLSEMTLDLMDYRGDIEERLQEMDQFLTQQNKISREMTNEIQAAQMVTLNSLMPRIKKIAQDISATLDKDVEVVFVGMEARISRKSIQKLMFSLEHLIRNAIYHGIESKSQRIANNKARIGKIEIIASETPEALTFTVKDDGQGINLDAVYRKAVEKGLISSNLKLSDREVSQLIFASGLSTSDTINEVSGRGIGLDSVLSELQKVGGRVNVTTEANKSTSITIMLPYSVNSNSVLMVKVNDMNLGIPLMYVKAISRLDGSDKLAMIDYGGNLHKVYDAGELLFGTSVDIAEDLQQRIIVLNEMHSLVALRVTDFYGVHEISLTAMADIVSVGGLYPASSVNSEGEVVLMLNPNVLIRRYGDTVGVSDSDNDLDKAIVLDNFEPLNESSLKDDSSNKVHKTNDQISCLIVDDSITVRKITQRLLDRHNFKTETAKDGLDALEKIKGNMPDVVLLDLEMPRMDGYDFMKVLRSEHSEAQVGVIMITSRVGEKHRKRATDLGVDQYLGKPYNDETLVSTIQIVANQN